MAIPYADMKKLAKALNEKLEKADQVPLVGVTKESLIKSLQAACELVDPNALAEDIRPLYDTAVKEDPETYTAAYQEAEKAKAAKAKQITAEDMAGLVKEYNEVTKIDPPIDIEGRTFDQMLADLSQETSQIKEDDEFSVFFKQSMQTLGIAPAFWGKAAGGRPKAPKAPKAPKPPKPARYTRSAALRAAMDEGVTKKEELITRAAAIYAEKNGGEPNERESRFIFGFATQVMEAFDIATYDGDNLVLKS